MKKVIISILTAAVVLGGLPASFAGPRPKAPNNTIQHFRRRMLSNGRKRRMQYIRPCYGFCMVRNLNQKLAEQLVDRRTFGRIAANRTDQRFTSIEDVWRRASVPIAML